MLIEQYLIPVRIHDEAGEINGGMIRPTNEERRPLPTAASAQKIMGRGKWIRTIDLTVPNQEKYGRYCIDRVSSCQ